MYPNIVDQTLNNIQRLVNENTKEVFIVDGEDVEPFLSNNINISSNLSCMSLREQKLLKLVVYKMENGSTMAVGIDKNKNQIHSVFAFNPDNTKRVRLIFSYDTDFNYINRKNITSIDFIRGLSCTIYESKDTGEIVHEEYEHNFENCLTKVDNPSYSHSLGGVFSVNYKDGRPIKMVFHTKDGKEIKLKSSMEEYLERLHGVFNKENENLEDILSTAKIRRK